MPNIMTKRGSLDNVVTYEHICDTTADMTNIPSKEITLGSICTVIQGDSGGLEVYIANSQKQWESITTLNGENTSAYSIHPCDITEYNAETGLPTIEDPDEATIYLVPSSNESNNLFTEYFYINGEWEKFGGATLDLSHYVEKITGKGLSTNDFTNADKDKLDAALTQHQDISSKANKTDTVLNTTLSLGRKANTTVGTNSVALGTDVTASGYHSHAEGAGTIASGNQSHAEGAGTTASGVQSHAEGGSTIASGNQSHAEGQGTKASGNNSHAEGASTTASGQYSHAEGGGTTASGNQSHAEGAGTTALGVAEHVSGQFNVLDTAPTWVASASYAVGNLVSKEVTFTDGEGTSRTRTVIYKCKTANSDSKFNSFKWEESGQYLFVIGNGTANNARSNAFTVGWTGNVTEGAGTTASGAYSHAEGFGGIYKINGTTYTSGALGAGDHTEGYYTRTASNSQPGNHAEGYQTAAIGGASHAEGAGTTASGVQSHAEGGSTTASGYQSHAEGGSTTASGAQEHVSGTYNTKEADEWISGTTYKVNDLVLKDNILFKCKTANSNVSWTVSNWQTTTRFLEAIGNGSSDNNRSNARSLDFNGNEYLKGDLYINCNADTTGGQKVATEAYVDARIPVPPTNDGTYTLQVTINNGSATYSWI